jgi:hypothetical protein
LPDPVWNGPGESLVIFKAAFSGQKADYFHYKEGIALGPVVHDGHEVTRRLGPCDLEDASGHLGLTESLQNQPGRYRLADDLRRGVVERVPAVPFNVPVGADEKQARGAQFSGEELQQHEAGVVGPVQIVHDDDHRRSPRCGTEKRAHGIEELKASQLGFQNRQRWQIGEGVGHLRDELGHD